MTYGKRNDEKTDLQKKCCTSQFCFRNTFYQKKSGKKRSTKKKKKRGMIIAVEVLLILVVLIGFYVVSKIGSASASGYG